MKKLLLCLLWTSCTSAQYHYTLTHRSDVPGFFSTFHTVLGALDFMETAQDCTGLTVDFADKGLYYDKELGSNWWSYYFEPLNVEKEKEEIKKFTRYQKVLFSVNSEFGMTRERGHELIQKYITIKPHIAAKIDDFCTANFKDTFVIGIHYRGTDKCLEADIVPYRDVAKKVKAFLKEKQLTHYTIFVATDDAYFISYMQAHFPNRVVFTDAIRSEGGAAIHFAEKSLNYKKGEDALIDCVLLSKCDQLFKMSSNLSTCSVKFNPTIAFIELNTSNGE